MCMMHDTYIYLLHTYVPSKLENTCLEKSRTGIFKKMGPKCIFYMYVHVTVSSLCTFYRVFFLIVYLGTDMCVHTCVLHVVCVY